MEYKFEITEVLSRQMTVQSSSLQEAERIVRSRYRQSDIVLDDSDFVCVDFTPLSREEKTIGISAVSSVATPFFRSPDRAFTLLRGDCVELLKQFEFKFDMIFA